MSWLEPHLSAILSLVVLSAGCLGAYFRLKYAVRAEVAARMHLKEDTEKRLKSITYKYQTLGYSSRTA